MDATLAGDVVHADEQAREQFYDARGYGRPRDDGLALAPVEAAHLLFRGDLTAVEGMDFQEFLASAAVSAVDFLVYKDLRDRGFYLSPGKPGWVDDAVLSGGAVDFVVYPRGKGPWDGAVAHRVRAVSERADVPAATLQALAGQGDGPGTGVLAVVDEESELTYLAVSSPDPSGSSADGVPGSVDAEVLSDRVLVADPPAAMHETAFYGQRLDPDADDLQLSLVEAAYLADRETLSVEGGAAALRERGRAVEGDRFDRRLRVYTALRSAGVVPKTGFKFGADFRTYAGVTDVADLGHSELLVRVLPPDHVFSPRDLALDVRLAHGVRKRMVFALAGETVAWLSVERLTP